MSEDVTRRPDRPATDTPTGSGSSGFLAVLLGGFIAGGAGYLAAYYTEFELFQVGNDQAAEVERLSAAFDEQAARLASLEESAAGTPSDEIPEAVRAEIGSVAESVAAISQRLDEVQSAGSGNGGSGAAAGGIAALQERLSALEERTGNPEQTETDASQSRQLSDLTGRLDQLSRKVETQAQQIASQAQTIDEQRQTIEGQTQAIAKAERAARRETNRISAQGAVSEIRAALENGASYADAIGEIEGTGEVQVPEALSAPAGSGVSTLAGLQDSFPPAAREALSQSVAATAGDGMRQRLGAFLRAQTGARSIGEKEGDGPDAILSRAEARLREGEIEAALSELDALPEQGKEAMSAWIAEARERLAAQQALSDLSQSVNSI